MKAASKCFLTTYPSVRVIKGWRRWGVGVEEVPLVRIHRYFVLSKQTVVTQLWHPLLKQLWRLHLVEHKMIDKSCEAFAWICMTRASSFYQELWTYLEVIDVVLGVQVNAHGFLFDRHNREADVYAAVNLPFLNLCKMTEVSLHGEQWQTQMRRHLHPSLASRMSWCPSPTQSIAEWQENKNNQMKKLFNNRNHRVLVSFQPNVLWI